MLHVLALGVVVLCRPGGGDVLDEARQLAESQDPRDREKAARRAAERADRPAALLLLQLADDDHAGVRNEAIDALRRLAQPDARALVCRAAVAGPRPRVRAAACEAAGAFDATTRGPALERALADRYAEVRAAAARALGETAEDSPAAATALRRLLRDPDAAVRCAAIESLAGVDAAGVSADVETLVRDRTPAVRIARLLALERAMAGAALRGAAIVALSDREWSVRAAAMDVLGRAGDLASATPLVAALRTSQGRLRRDCTRALQRISGKSIGPDPDLWDAWLAAQWGSRNGGGMRDRPRRAPDTVATFYDIPIESDRVVFILDLSKSMGDAPKPGDPPRIETAKAAIAKAIHDLPLGALVNAISFGKELVSFQPRCFLATGGARAQLTRWIQKRPIGGPTNIYDSIELAMQDPKIDSIFLLSDGGASVGTFIDNGDILEHIARLNRYRRVAINCIAVGRTTRGRSLLRQLAEGNFGMYVEK